MKRVDHRDEYDAQQAALANRERTTNDGSGAEDKVGGCYSRVS
jgi:hypothetical protein